MAVEKSKDATPKKPAPETKASETKASETKASETKAPETKTSETKVAAVKSETAATDSKPDAAPKRQGMGEGQKPVSKAYKDNWNDIFGKKNKR